MTDGERRKMYAREGLYVEVRHNSDGGVTIFGQDLRGGFPPGSAEYEYAITIETDALPIVVATLGGRPGDDVVEMLVTNAAEIVTVGELTWLRQIGVRPRIWTHAS
jgi:hypothetical protein